MPTPSNPVTLSDAKAQCRVTHSDDDALIQQHLNAAVEQLIGDNNRLGYELEDGAEIPDRLRQAILLQVELLYDAGAHHADILERSINHLTDPLRRRFIA